MKSDILRESKSNLEEERTEEMTVHRCCRLYYVCDTYTEEQLRTTAEMLSDFINCDFEKFPTENEITLRGLLYLFKAYTDDVVDNNE